MTTPLVPASTPESPVPFIRDQAEQLKTAMGAKPSSVYEGLLPSSLEQIYAARDAFAESARHALTTVLLAYSAGAAGLWAWASADQPRAWAQSVVMGALCAAAFLIPFACRNLLVRKIEAGYDLYITAAVHARVVFAALGVPCTHRWPQMVDLCAGALGTVHRANKAEDSGAFPDRDEWEFRKGRSAVGDQLVNAGCILAVWEAWTPNLLGFYRTLFRVWMVRASWTLAAASVLLGTAGALRPHWFWPQGAGACRTWTIDMPAPAGRAGVVERLPATPERVDDGIGVHVRSAGQTPREGLTLRVAFGPQFSLDQHGECRIHGPYGGAAYELRNAHGRVLKAGVLPKSEDLFIDLE